MEELLTMTRRELDKLRVIRQVLEHKLRWREAVRQLGLSTRQIARLCIRVRTDGNKGIIHRLRGRGGAARWLRPCLIRRTRSPVRAAHLHRRCEEPDPRWGVCRARGHAELAAHYEDLPSAARSSRRLLRRQGLDLPGQSPGHHRGAIAGYGTLDPVHALDARAEHRCHLRPQPYRPPRTHPWKDPSYYAMHRRQTASHAATGILRFLPR